MHICDDTSFCCKWCILINEKCSRFLLNVDLFEIFFLFPPMWLMEVFFRNLTQHIYTRHDVLLRLRDPCCRMNSFFEHIYALIFWLLSFKKYVSCSETYLCWCLLIITARNSNLGNSLCFCSHLSATLFLSFMNSSVPSVQLSSMYTFLIPYIRASVVS